MSLRKRAFTLIELLVVIAITAILMTLIVVPLIQSFNLTRQAQAWADAQDKARSLSEKIAHEINNARYVRDNSGAKGRLDLVITSPTGGLLTGYDPNAKLTRVSVFNAKIDLVKPSEGDPSLYRNGAFVNPLNNMADPTAGGPLGMVNLPSTPGLTIIRYFIGLRNPLRTAPGGGYAGYIEPYTGILQQRNGLRDNLYVLYRAEVQPMIWDQNQGRFVVNKQFFYDLDRDNDPLTSGPLYDDPTFFDPTINYPAYAVSQPGDPTKAQMVQNWLNAATIQTEVSRFDMLQPVYDKNSRQPLMNGGVPVVMPLVQFRPTRVSDEPAQGQEAVRLGLETDAPSALASDVFLTKFGGWSNAIMSFYPNNYSTPSSYEVGLPSPDGKSTDVWVWDPSADGPTPLKTSIPAGYMLINGARYRQSLDQGIRAGLTRAMVEANIFDISFPRGDWLGDAAMRNSFTAFAVDPDHGRVRLSYGIDELGLVGAAPDLTPVPLPDPTFNPNNLPSAVTWPDSTPPLSPVNDPTLTTGVFSDPQFSSINRKFNKLWHDFPGLRGNIHRFMDLRITPNSDGADSPLNPDPLKGFARAFIVPGSEEIYGPDQNAGPNYGRRVRYWRTTRQPGPNQYRINYTDLPEPDYSLLGLAAPPATYTATDLSSAVIQPQYKAGYIEFNSDPNVPLPGDDPNTARNEAEIQVYYRFQFSRPKDSIMVNYDSRQLMTVQITIRNYPQSSLPNPQSVTLEATAKVRNFQR